MSYLLAQADAARIPLADKSVTLTIGLTSESSW